MENSVQPSKPLLPKTSKWFLIIFIVIAFLGFIDATYLTVKHFIGSPVTCEFLKGCEEVTSSSWSSLFGIPVALMGAGYYLGMVVLAMLYLDTKNQIIGKLLPRLTILGLLASLYFVGLQMFVVKAYCLYCMGSAITSTTLFGMGLNMWIKENLSTDGEVSSKKEEVRS